jgi:hypothetical protein
VRHNLDGMTAEKWHALSDVDRRESRDLGGLSAQLSPYRGWRVDVQRTDGTKDRFIVGQSMGWRPCTLERRTRASVGGMMADRAYTSVRPLYKVRTV